MSTVPSNLDPVAGTHDRRVAIQILLEEPPFAGSVSVLLGDDVNEQDGFRAVNELGGVSIRVGEIEDSEARFRLPDVAAVRRCLPGAVLDDHHEQQNGDSRI